MTDSPADPARNDAPAERAAPSEAARPTVADGPVRVMHVITGLHTGGAETQLANLLCHDARASGEAFVVSLLPGGSLAERLRAAGIRVVDLGMVRGRPSLRSLVRLIWLIRRHRPAIIQSWLYHADFMALMALRLSGRRRATRLVWGIRCSDMDAVRYGRGLRWVIRACVRRSGRPDAVCANSDAGRTYHLGLGYNAERFVVVPNGIDTARFHPDEQGRAAIRRALGVDSERALIAHVARVDPMKDHTSFLAALGRLPEVEALLIGAGTELLPTRPGVHNLGRRTDVPRLLAACDLFVSSSAFGEGFSNAIAEAMASGLPVVATDVGDAGMIVGDTGLVVPPGDVEALVRAVCVLLSESPSERAKRGRAARARIDAEFSIGRCQTAYDELYESLN